MATIDRPVFDVEAVTSLDSDPLVKGHNLQSALFDAEVERNLFFGTGLCTSKELSAGFPVDFLLYLYCS